MASQLAREIRRRMTASGFNQKSLARAAGLNETAVRDILIGKSRHPRHDTVQKLAASLGCPVMALLEPGTEHDAATPADAGARDGELVFVSTYEVSAAAGEGIVIDNEYKTGRLAFRRDWLRGVTSATTGSLAVITVNGDSMYPTLADGDTILVDMTQRSPSPRRHLHRPLRRVRSGQAPARRSDPPADHDLLRQHQLPAARAGRSRRRRSRRPRDLGWAAVVEHIPIDWIRSELRQRAPILIPTRGAPPTVRPPLIP